jgi:hypothetical protein
MIVPWTPHDRLYLYEGCSKHGCKIGIARERSLAGRLMHVRRRCPHSKQFAMTWALPNAFEIEQSVITILGMSGRHAPPGEEWFCVPREEMIDAVGFAMELHDPDRNRPRRYRMVCGHVWQEAG